MYEAFEIESKFKIIVKFEGESTLVNTGTRVISIFCLLFPPAAVTQFE